MSFQQILPLTDPLWRTVLVLAVILAVPALCRKLRFPQIAGLIIAGVILGPGLSGILESDAILSYASRIGLIFIMFFAGIQTDIEEMKRNKAWGFAFGILTFVLSFGACVWVGTAVLGLSGRASAIMGSIMGSHTLVSYPIVTRFGLERRKSITITVAGALVAILLSLTVYSVLNSNDSGSGIQGILLLLVKICLYFALIILSFPHIIRSFFHKASSHFSHFLFVMLLLATSCSLASLIGLDAILGAFLAGLMLNRYVPNTSPLMHRMDFIGNALFIPVFLFSTGMMIDIKGAVSDWDTLFIFSVIFLAGTAAKWLAAFITQKAAGFGRDDRLLIFGLSESHAAGALAITTGAYATGIIGLPVLSATVLIVLFSCIASNIITEKTANRMYQANNIEEKDSNERLLVTLTGSNTLQAIMDTAMTIRPDKGPDMVGLYVTIGGEHAPKYMQDGKGRLNEAAAIAASASIPFITHNRLGNNIVDSITHATREFDATTLLMGMPLRRSITTYYYENIVSPLLEGVESRIVLQRMTIPLNTVRRIIVLVPGPVLQDGEFGKAIDTISKICSYAGCSTVFYGKSQAMDAVHSCGYAPDGGRVTFLEVSETADMDWAINELHADHMLIMLGTRDRDSHADRAFRHLFERIHLKDNDFSTMLVFPGRKIESGPVTQEMSSRTSRDLLKMLRI